jgi:hypothetical protein
VKVGEGGGGGGGGDGDGGPCVCMHGAGELLKVRNIVLVNRREKCCNSLYSSVRRVDPSVGTRCAHKPTGRNR